MFPKALRDEIRADEIRAGASGTSHARTSLRHDLIIKLAWNT
jgi:hypothetical protein